MSSGGSATPFSLKLPPGAACAGDSEDDGYRVSSYMVPLPTDPAGLTYSSVGPSGPGQRALYDVTTSSYVDALTAPAAKAGDPGAVINIPAFTFGIYRPGELPAGTYSVGIACTLQRRTEQLWNTQMTVVADPADAPAAIRWTAAGTEQASRSTRPVVLVIGALGVTAAVSGLGFRRRTKRSRERTFAGRPTEELL